MNAEYKKTCLDELSGSFEELIQYIETGGDLLFAYRANRLDQGKCLAKNIDAFEKHTRGVAQVFFAECLSAGAFGVLLPYRLPPKCLIDVLGNQFLLIRCHALNIIPRSLFRKARTDVISRFSHPFPADDHSVRSFILCLSSG